MSNQLIKTTGLGKENVFPRTRILDLFDDTSGLKLIDILKSFNMMFVPYLGNKFYTRNQISPELRRQGLWLTYVIDNTVYTEWYGEVAIDDTNWGSDSNWRQGSNALVGDLSISPNGTWVINGEDSGITIKGDKGDSPVIRIYDNKILVSYDKGVTYEDLNNTPIYTKFRFNSLTNTYLVSYDLGANWEDISGEKVYHKFRYNSATNTYLESVDFGKTWSNISAEKVYTKFRYNAETNTHLVSTDLGLNWTDISSNKVYYLFRTNDNRLLVSTDLGTTWKNCSEPIAAWFRWADTSGTGNIGKVLISRDNNTWEDLSPTITNNLYIKGYVSTVEKLPTSSAAIGDIYMVGPTYDESDATHDYPHYRMWIKLSSGWVDNGEYLSNILISLSPGLEAGITMSLKAITNAIIYDVSAHNNGIVFESLQALLSSSNLSTLIPTSVRHGGMTIRFIQGSVPNSDNKYVQYRLMSTTWSNTVADWQGVDDEPTAGSDNLVKSGAVADKISKLESYIYSEDNPEYVSVELDIDDRILSSIDKDGNKKENLPTDFTKSLKLKGKNVLTEDIDISSFANKNEVVPAIEIESYEYLKCITDTNDKVICGILKDGSLYVQKLSSPELTKLQRKIDNKSNNTLYNSNSSRVFFGGNNKIGKCFGFNAHFGQDVGNMFNPFLDDIKDIAKKGGFNIIRVELSPEMSYFQEEGIELCSIMYDVSTIDESSFVNNVTTYLQKYNGITKLTRDDGKEVTINCKYWEFFNELDLKWAAGKTTTEQAFNMYKLAYKTVKSIRQDVYVVLGGLASMSTDFVNTLCDYNDPEGYKFWDLFDIFNIHTYSIDYKSMSSLLLNIWNTMKVQYDVSLDTNFIEKPVWVSEFNAPSYRYGDYEQSLLIPVSILTMLSYGVDVCEVYELVDNESLMLKRRIVAPAESFFGLCRRDYPNCSYASFLKNDGIYDKALSNGDDLKRYYFSSDKICFIGSLNQVYTRAEYDNLKETGLALSGKGFTVTAMYKIKGFNTDSEERTELWQGERKIIDEESVFTWDSSYFSTVESGDVIWFDVKDITSIDHTVCNFIPKLSYYSYKFLTKLLKESYDKPNIYTDGDVHIAYWKLSNGNNVAALWSDTAITIKLKINGEASVIFDYMGNIINTVTSLEKNKIIYITNFNSIDYE